MGAGRAGQHHPLPARLLPARRLTTRLAAAARPRAEADAGTTLSNLKAIAPLSAPAQGPEGTRSRRGPLPCPALRCDVTDGVPVRCLSGASGQCAQALRAAGLGSGPLSAWSGSRSARASQGPAARPGPGAVTEALGSLCAGHEVVRGADSTPPAGVQLLHPPRSRPPTSPGWAGADLKISETSP